MAIAENSIPMDALEIYLNDLQRYECRNCPNTFDKIDNEIFLCPICGWWCENCERTSNNISLDSEDICEDCHESGEEE